MLGKIIITGFYPTIPDVLSAPQTPINRFFKAGAEGEMVGMDDDQNVFLKIGKVICVADPVQLEMTDTFDEVPLLSALTH